jgi:hypothetical protein
VATSGLHGASVTSDGVIAVAERHKATFGAEGIVFTPAFGARAPTNRPANVIGLSNAVRVTTQ